MKAETKYRKVRVRMSISYEVKVPEDWDADMIEFHRNGSGWCSANCLDELENLGRKPLDGEEDDICLCGTDIKFEYLGEEK